MVEPIQLIGPLIAFGLVVVVPLVAIFTSHQRRMAELLHRQSSTNATSDHRVAQLEAQISDLRNRVNDLTLLVDDRQPSSLTSRLSPPPIDDIVRNG